MRGMLAALALAALLALPTVAQAHAQTYTQSQSFAVGPYLIYFEPRPSTPFANETMSVVAQFADNATGALLRDVPATVLVGGPAQFTFRGRLNPDGTGYHVASMTLPAAGMYSARVIIRDEANGVNYTAQLEFEAFPDVPFRVRPVDSGTDTHYVGERTPLAFEFIDPDTFARKDPGDLMVRVEHWTEDHSAFLGGEEATATRVTSGVWRIDHVFKETGMYHLRFASQAGGFNYADVPLLHVYATVRPAQAETNDTPFPTLGVAALVLALALALPRRR